MSHCCSNKLSKVQTSPCPQCGYSSKRVTTKTLLHHIVFPDNLDIPIDDYYFCADISCKVGYFGSSMIFPKKKLIAWAELDQDLLCYCFNILSSDYLLSKNPELIKNFVIQKTQAGLCACEIKNPSGQCCLAEFKALDKQNT